MDEQVVTLDLLDTEWCPVQAEVRIRRDTVETRCRGKLVGVQDREVLTDWLASPWGILDVDQLSWMCSGWAVSVCITGMVPTYRLTTEVVEDLRRHLVASPR
jgi:hypothetical protein